MKKRVFILLTCLMCGILWMSAFEYKGFKFSVISEEDKTCSVNGFANASMSEVIIPEEAINEKGAAYSVTEVGKYAFWELGENVINIVKLPNSVIKIGECAFLRCQQLSSCDLPKNLISIGFGSFEDCKSLVSIDFPQTLTTIGEKSFMGCEKLTSVKFPNSLTSIGSQAFQDCIGLIMLDYPAANVSVGSGAFSKCSGLVKINFPEDISLIGKSADQIGVFSGCISLKSIDFPASVTEIGQRTFAYCTGLTSLDLPIKLTKIDDAAFHGCTELQTVNFPKTLERIGSSSFSNCSGLTTLIFPESLKNIYSNAFNRCNGLTNIVFNSGPYLDSDSFSQCPNINIIIYNTEEPFIYKWGMSIFDYDRIKTIFGNSTYEEAYVLVPQTILDKIKGITPWNYFEKIDQIPIATLNTDNLKIWAGDKDNINVSIIPEDSPLGNAEIKWTSSNTDIITVTDSGDSASVSNLGKGNAEVYCNLNWRGLWNQTCKSQVTIMEVLTGIEIENTQSSLLKGESIAITTITNPIEAYDPKYKWSSSDETVANIIPSTNGNALLTGLKAGKVTITVEAEQEGSKGGHASKSMEFTILQPVESLSLDPAAIEAEEGDTFQITATVLPEDAADKTLEWSSSDESIATVDQTGLVSVLKEGECVITAKTTDGSDLTANCYLSVTKGIILAESLSLNPAAKEAVEGDTFQITATVLPEDATDKTLEWSSSDESVATVDQTGLVSVLKEGECVITAKTTDGSDLTANCYLSATSGINDIFFDTDETVDVYSLDGVKVRTNCKKNEALNLPAGVYLLRKGNKVKKLIIR